PLCLMKSASQDSATAEGGYEFTCQHGSRECAGNQMLACAKSYITEEKDYVDFNICVMTSISPPLSGEKCSSTVGISVWPSIDECSTSVEGEILLHDIGVKTHSLDPVLDYVPWMVYDGTHTDEIQDQMEHDLLTFVCTNYAGETPSAC
ncbi:Gamma interferon inducible lysosomal thiol reductase GILT, partial [Trinorchestia longiramus]